MNHCGQHISPLVCVRKAYGTSGQICEPYRGWPRSSLDRSFVCVYRKTVCVMCFFSPFGDSSTHNFFEFFTVNSVIILHVSRSDERLLKNCRLHKQSYFVFFHLNLFIYNCTYFRKKNDWEYQFEEKPIQIA